MKMNQFFGYDFRQISATESNKMQGNESYKCTKKLEDG